MMDKMKIETTIPIISDSDETSMAYQIKVVGLYREDGYIEKCVSIIIGDRIIKVDTNSFRKLFEMM